MTVIVDPVARWRADAKREIDLRAEALRSLFYVGGPGQVAEYVLKEQEALRYLEDDSAQPTWPMLASDAAADGHADLAAAATAIIAQAEIWRAALAAINEIRRGAKRAVDASSNADVIREAVDGVSEATLIAVAPIVAAALDS